jgi:hypothetical protein
MLSVLHGETSSSTSKFINNHQIKQISGFSMERPIRMTGSNENRCFVVTLTCYPFSFSSSRSLDFVECGEWLKVNEPERMVAVAEPERRKTQRAIQKYTHRERK